MTPRSASAHSCSRDVRICWVWAPIGTDVDTRPWPRNPMPPSVQSRWNRVPAASPAHAARGPARTDRSVWMPWTAMWPNTEPDAGLTSLALTLTPVTAPMMLFGRLLLPVLVTGATAPDIAISRRTDRVVSPAAGIDSRAVTWFAVAGV